MVDRSAQRESASRSNGDRVLRANDVAIVHASLRLAVADDRRIPPNEFSHRDYSSIGEYARVRAQARPAFVHDLRLSLRHEVISLVADDLEHVALPAFERRVIEQEPEDVALRLFGDLALGALLRFELLL